MNITNLISIAISVTAIIISTLNSFLNFRQNRFGNQSLRGQKTTEVVDMFFDKVTPLFSKYLESEKGEIKRFIDELPSETDLDNPELIQIISEGAENTLMPKRRDILNHLERVSSIAVNQPVLLNNLKGSMVYDFLEIFTKFKISIDSSGEDKFSNIRQLSREFSKYNLGDEKDVDRRSN